MATKERRCYLCYRLMDPSVELYGKRPICGGCREEHQLDVQHDLPVTTSTTRVVLPNEKNDSLGLKATLALFGEMAEKQVVQVRLAKARALTYDGTWIGNRFLLASVFGSNS